MHYSSRIPYEAPVSLESLGFRVCGVGQGGLGFGVYRASVYSSAWGFVGFLF